MMHPKFAGNGGTSPTRLIHEFSHEYNETCRYVARSATPQPPLLKEIGKNRNPGYTPAMFAVQCAEAGVPAEHLARLGHIWFTLLERLYPVDGHACAFTASKAEQPIDNEFEVWQVAATPNMSEADLWAGIERATAHRKRLDDFITIARREIAQRRYAEREARSRLTRAVVG